MTQHRDQKDDDTVIIKPLSYAVTLLLAAGAGLAAGLLICWLWCQPETPEYRATDALSGSGAHASAQPAFFARRP